MMISPSVNRTPILLDGINVYTSNHLDCEFTNLSVLYIDVVDFSEFEQVHGYGASNHVLEVLSDTLHELISESACPWTNVQALRIWDDGFTILLPQVVLSAEHIRNIHEFVHRTQDIVNARVSFVGYTSLRLRYGLSSALSIDEQRPGERLYQLITLAGRNARRGSGTKPLFLIEELERLIESKNISSYYQPIIHLETMTPFGWEGLSRGPMGSDLEHPRVLFDCAEQLGYLLDVERICRNQSIRQSKVGPGDKLFINLSPKILSEPTFRQGETLKVIEEVGLDPKQIVFEITEHHAIDDYPSFLKVVKHYRDQGYQIAIDDVGAGYSGLVTLMQVKPDFVKVDMELVRGIENDSTKQDIVRAINYISSGFAGKVIAEGIETPDELACIQQCGVHYGQGFLLGRPKSAVGEEI
ncbi:EAL domain-containing protein [Alicyclobacillus fastidiosus]|uniref:EAL domain-containing protein n=1 Tax=Alicyclobacillus fastidiosus TaxID=392011 RepID=A0ABV5AJW2_9BACL|nr:EAL domain-containing protein [Alicyclobacillus fastidiosus]WEH11051.1 EAL domain-containing protein [Alicyclobacillus fastidiosus]